jgi:starch phosphorylase
MMRRGTGFVLEVNPKIPRELSRLKELAFNLWYSWHRPARELFARLHPHLWDAVGHTPVAFLQQVDQQRLNLAAHDPEFIASYDRVLSDYDRYHADTQLRSAHGWDASDQVAYFCAEFGLHESLPIYSGGLGILAGDHCKAASDMRLPFVGVGLLYRQGYFAQTIGPDGSQIATYTDADFASLPANPVMHDGSELRVSVSLPGRTVTLRVWHVRAGHVNLYFLDSDIPENNSVDRRITFRLYGGDRTVRLEQEIVLGIGGVRALRALSIRPTVWHINEGHAAFLILERARELVAGGTAFAAALEAVAANVVFTTHTAVPAGHDYFDNAVIERYFSEYCRDTGIAPAQLFELGSMPGGPDFNMTALAVRGSRSCNAVSRIHAEVTSRILQELWPQIPPDENPIGHVTNAVHVPTFLAPEWADAFGRCVGADWYERVKRGGGAACLDDLPDEVFWSVHQRLKRQLLHLVRHRVSVRHFRSQGSAAQLERILRLVNPEEPGVLTIGFARRFATYKRAALLFDSLERLRSIACDAKQPVIFIFAGKAHPADAPGQDVIREIARIARLPEFEDKILLLEGYDLHLARRLVKGVDVWLNNPIYPLEASGTSGMKAGMNGVLNLSLLDGWWNEGYQRGSGWAIPAAGSALDQDTRNHEEARALYELLQNEVVPLYYARGNTGYSSAWVAMAKQSIATLLPRFDASRMVGEYVDRIYVPAATRSKRLDASGPEAAAQLSAWKTRVRAAWPAVAIRRIEDGRSRIAFGDNERIAIAVQLAGLEPADVRVELLLERPSLSNDPPSVETAVFKAEGAVGPDGWHRYTLDLAPAYCGRLQYFMRAYPSHELLAHRFELGLMVWN